MLFSFRRFQSTICDQDNRYFKRNPKANQFEDYASTTFHSTTYRTDLKNRIQHYLTNKLDMNQKLWEAQISSGALGSSGAISKQKVRSIRAALDEADDNDQHDQHANNTETLLLFRSHHALADGVSLGSVMYQLSDEADVIGELIEQQVKLYQQKSKRRRRNMTAYQKLLRLWTMFWNAIMSMLKHGLLVLTSSNPFDAIIKQSSIGGGKRSVSWCDACTVEEAKKIAKVTCPGSTVNDLFVSCILAAVARQLQAHHCSFKRSQSLSLQPPAAAVPRSLNVIIPVHLTGGVLLPGEGIGNRIGAFVSSITTDFLPSSESYSSAQNLSVVSKSLCESKASPAPFISWMAAKFCSDYLPETVTKFIMRSANANAVCVVSNVRSPASLKLHYNGRPVESMAGFLPLPPDVPIGVVVQSYQGAISLTVTADKRAVPDADQFLCWVLEEYQRLNDLSKVT